MRRNGVSPDCEAPYPLRSGTTADLEHTSMLKTFSFSALLFMTLGVIAATHAGLPF
ncbi:hypothetical protein [Devosia sp.]|uniref:hypothetical protein n=1 Tax=Devosia sp. TaxID=1871048 RepID=UPI0035B0817C